MMDRAYPLVQSPGNPTVQNIEQKFIILYDGFGFPHC